MATVHTNLVLAALARLGHATNQELYDAVAARIPDLSLSSLHRITARLLERGEVGAVPTSTRTVVLDARPEPHDHYVCEHCSGVLDIEVSRPSVEPLQEHLGTDLEGRGLVITGCWAGCHRNDPPVSDAPAPATA